MDWLVVVWDYKEAELVIVIIRRYCWLCEALRRNIQTRAIVFMGQPTSQYKIVKFIWYACVSGESVRLVESLPLVQNVRKRSYLWLQFRLHVVQFVVDFWLHIEQIGQIIDVLHIEEFVKQLWPNVLLQVSVEFWLKIIGWINNCFPQQNRV